MGACEGDVRRCVCAQAQAHARALKDAAAVGIPLAILHFLFLFAIDRRVTAIDRRVTATTLATSSDQPPHGYYRSNSQVINVAIIVIMIITITLTQLLFVLRTQGSHWDSWRRDLFTAPRFLLTSS
jgi:hypothetical protein